MPAGQKQTRAIERLKCRGDARYQAAQGKTKPASKEVWVKMYVHIRDWQALLRGCPLAVLINLGSRIDANYECYPSVGTIAKQTGYSKSAVRLALRFLREKHFISYDVQKWQGDGSQHTSNTFKVSERLFEFGEHDDDEDAK